METQEDLHEFTIRCPEAVALCRSRLTRVSAPTSVEALRARCVRGNGPRYVLDKGSGPTGLVRFRPEDLAAWIHSHQPREMRQAFEIAGRFRLWLERWDREQSHAEAASPMIAEAQDILEAGGGP